jgi:hypothetical protein
MSSRASDRRVGNPKKLPVRIWIRIPPLRRRYPPIWNNDAAGNQDRSGFRGLVYAIAIEAVLALVCFGTWMLFRRIR